MLVEDFYTRDELDPCKDAIEVLVDKLANKLYSGGKIKSKFHFNYIFNNFHIKNCGCVGWLFLHVGIFLPIIYGMSTVTFEPNVSNSVEKIEEDMPIG